MCSQVVESALETIPKAQKTNVDNLPIKVLHVDDEEDFLSVAKECLELEGAFNVHTASSVDEAIEKMKKSEYDAIICDYFMPKKDGLTFLEMLRKDGNNIPFIIFTGKGGEEIAVRALNLGADGYINKNGDPHRVYCELAHIIGQAIEKRKSEKLLKLSEAKYRAVFDSSNDCILLLDLKGNIMDVNNVAMKYGFRKEDLIGRNVTEFVSLKDKLQLLKDIAKKLRGESVENLIEVKTPKGNVLAAYRCKPLVVDGRVVGIHAVLADVTKSKEMERNYQAVFENTGTAMCIIDEDNTLSLVNKEFEKISGYSKGEIEGKKKWTEFVTPEYRRIMEKYQVERRRKGGKAPTQYTFDFMNRNGQKRKMLINVGLLPGTKKSVASLLDITEYEETQKKIKKLSEALHESEETYRALINGMNDTAWVIGFDGKFIDVNDAAVRVLGYSRDELLKMGPPDIDSTLTEEQIRELIKNMPKDKIQVFETTHITKDGRIIPVEISSSLVTYKGKTAILSIARDLTERKKAEEKLRKTMDELRLANEKLSVVGKWTRHDARNKLSVIKSHIYLAKKKLPADHPALKHLNEVELACDQIVRIFDFASQYEMLGKEKRFYVNVGKSIDDAISLISNLNNIKIINNCYELTVLADSQLRQLFYNLIDNSVKHGKTVNQIKIHFEEDEDKLNLVYEDNGVGISDKVRRNLFKEGHGEVGGYGLYLAAKLCEIYGWKIDETGEYGKGAKFTLTIPKTNVEGEQLYKLHR
ncbi:MAG: PAS domain S-box protein [Nitrososphaerota archaeon]|nr:PAS domain S-box protein [Candidatus Bathyarchaeota archaeon]MDW8049147.1 PAS domain S-box protein [Nitrososphaerota archaeon]